jgi:predicted nuclease with TOPRIM domain
VLGLHPGEDRIRNANAADEPEDHARERQEIERDLEKARARNTELQERLKEMEAYEAQLERAESLARVHPDSMTQAHPER